MARDVERIYDELLVVHAQAGDARAFTRLVERWRPKLVAHATRLTGRPDLAQDVVQEAWLAAVQGLARLDEPARFPAWIFRITTRRCMDAHRRAARDGRLAADAAETAPDHVPAPSGESDDLARALTALPAEQRAAVALFYGEDLAVAEIAVALGVPEGTVKTRLFHARKALRQALEGD
jgi:RNA polymerase sigma-70 factor (ECF subfamily)